MQMEEARGGNDASYFYYSFLFLLIKPLLPPPLSPATLFSFLTLQFLPFLLDYELQRRKTILILVSAVLSMPGIEGLMCRGPQNILAW